MTVDQLLDWQAYMLLQPIEPQRDDTRAGLIAALLANAAGHKTEDGSALGPDDMLRTHMGAIAYREDEPNRQVAMFARATAKMRGFIGPLTAAWKK
jgi:hypothetical protein